MSIDAEATRGVDEAYVVVAAGVAPDGERVDRERAGQRRPIVFVPDESVAPRVVVGLVAEGIDLVELYGGFGPTSAAAVSAAIGGRARRLRGDHRGPGDRRGRAAGARGGGELRRRGPRRRGRLLGPRGGLGHRPSMTGRAEDPGWKADPLTGGIRLSWRAVPVQAPAAGRGSARPPGTPRPSGWHGIAGPANAVAGSLSAALRDSEAGDHGADMLQGIEGGAEAGGGALRQGGPLAPDVVVPGVPDAGSGTAAAAIVVSARQGGVPE